MAPLGLSGNKLALALRVPATRILEITHERRGISTETALRLERYFGVEAEFWLNLQKGFELRTARAEQKGTIDKEVVPRTPSGALPSA